MANSEAIMKQGELCCLFLIINYYLYIYIEIIIINIFEVMLW